MQCLSVLLITRKDVDAECRHDMRPSVQMTSVSGVVLTMARPSLQSAPEPLALVPPPISKHIHQGANYKKILRLSYDVIITYDNRKSNLR